MAPTNTWDCKLCDKTFAHKQSLHNHKLRNHGTSSHSCEKCKKTFKSLFALKRHVRNERCKTESTLECEVCQVKFSRASTLKRHVSAQHSPSQEKTFACESCEKSFFSSTALREHKKEHVIKVMTKPKSFVKTKRKTYDTNDMQLALGENNTLDYGQLDEEDFQSLSMVRFFQFCWGPSIKNIRWRGSENGHRNH